MLCLVMANIEIGVWNDKGGYYTSVIHEDDLTPSPDYDFSVLPNQ